MEILKDIIPVIDENKNYWLVRTQGGKYYEEFKSGNFIAIGWNKITLDDLFSLEHHDLVKKIIKEYPKRIRPVRLANQLSSFAKDIKAGDTVIIPSAGSNKITIGEVEDDVPYLEYVDENAKGPDGRKLCPFQKRRRVRWIKTFSKWDLDMEFYKLFKSQHTISNANEYASFIDRMLHTFFIRGNEAHLILEVKKEGKIPFQALFPMGTEILNLAEDFNKKTAASLDLSNIEVKINVQSPGRIHLTGPVKTMLVIGFLLVLLVGGEVSVDIPIIESTVNVRMGSLLEKLADFMDRYQDLKRDDFILKTYMKELKVETPDELKTLMEIEHNPDLNHESNSKE